jgi:hypothetical protein
MPNKLPHPFEPVDAVSITTLVDNFPDIQVPSADLDFHPPRGIGLMRRPDSV